MPLLSSSLSLDDCHVLAQWALIINWPGLDKVHVVKITRLLDARTITQQFHDNVLMCPKVFNNVMYSLKNRRLVYGEDYIFFLRTVVKYLQRPSRFFAEYSGKSIEDLIINEFGKHIIEHYGEKEGFKKTLKKSGVKQDILFAFDCVRTKRKKDESYLRLSFAEDVQRSRGELSNILKRYKN